MTARARVLRVVSGAALVAVVTAAVIPRSASASTGYPAEMERYLVLSYAPKCSICHEGADGGPTDTPFARSMTARGLKSSEDDASLDAALDAMKRDRVDSDGDGPFDLDVISYGGDPNHADVPQGAPARPPSYGCAVAPAAQGVTGIALAFGLATTVAFRRRGRRRR